MEIMSKQKIFVVIYLTMIDKFLVLWLFFQKQ